MKYCYVKNGSVVSGPSSLPISTENISNFNLLGNEELKQYGWYPHRLISVVVPENCVLSPSTFTITETEVIEQQNYRAMDQDEITTENERLWAIIRNTRGNLLSKTDWTQMSDSPLTESKKLEWRTYRQQLRDIPEVYTNPRDVVWPSQPS